MMEALIKFAIIPQWTSQTTIIIDVAEGCILLGFAVIVLGLCIHIIFNADDDRGQHTETIWITIVAGGLDVAMATVLSIVVLAG